MGTELEFSLLMSKPKPELVPCKNIKFVIFSALASVPLLCFLVFFDTVLRKTLVTTSNFVWDKDVIYTFDLETNTTHEGFEYLCSRLGLFCFLNLVPYQLVELYTLVAVADAASDIYGGKNNKTISLKQMIGTLIAYICVMLFSTAALIGLLWIVINYYFLTGGFWSYLYDCSIIKIVLFVIHGAAYLALLRKYLEWSAGWNVSLVVSVLGEAYGGEALDGSDYLTRGRRERGLVLMAVFFLWVACVWFGCGPVVVSFGVMGIVCLGNVMKWVAFVVCFSVCKRRVLEKKVDVEVVGSEGKVGEC